MRFWLDLFVKKGEESPWFALRCSPPSLRALAAPQRPGIDTNVIVSALLKWNSVPGVVLQAVFNGFVVPVYNDEILNEYRNVLNRPKFGFSSELISETISQIESLGVMENALETVAEAMPDPKDIVFYSIALSHGKTAETHLVTGNVKHFPANPIVVTPRQMLDILCM